MKTDHVIFGREKYTPIRTNEFQPSTSVYRKTGNSVFQKTGENLFGYSREKSSREKANLSFNNKDFLQNHEESKTMYQTNRNFHTGTGDSFSRKSPQPQAFKPQKQGFTPNIYNSFNITKGSKFYPQPRSSSFSEARHRLPTIQNRNYETTVEELVLDQSTDQNDLMSLLSTQQAIRKNLPSRQSTSYGTNRMRTESRASQAAQEDYISDDSVITGIPFILVHSTSDVVWLFNCKICDNLVLEPVRCEKCQTLYCRKCIKTTSFENRGNCPSCNNQFVPDKVDPQTVQILNQVETDCPYNQYGCKKLLKYQEYEQHASNCPQQKYNCRRCQKGIFQENLDEHLEKCPEYPVTCNQCQKQLPRRDFQKHRQSDCMTYIVNTMIFTNYNLADRIDRLQKQLHEKDKQIVELKQIFQGNTTQPELINVNVGLTQNHPRIIAEEVDSSAIYTCQQQIVNDFKAFLGAPICLTEPYQIHCQNQYYLNFQFPKLSGDAIIGLQFLDGITNNNALSLDNHGKAIEMKLVDDVWKCIARDDIISIQFQENELIQLTYNPFNISLTISNLNNQSCVAIPLEKFVIGSSEFVFLCGLFRKDDQVAFMLPSSQSSGFKWKLD